MHPAMRMTAAVNDDDFNFFRELIHQLTGITLSDAKKELLQSRLRSRVQTLGLEGYGDYRAYLQSLSREHAEWQNFINLLTTNKTDWFREPAHFQYLVEEFLPRWRKSGKDKLRIWSAACSTGEEPYTTAIVLESLPISIKVPYEILATDIDTEVLGVAKNGVYSRSRLEQVPEQYRKTSFALGSEEISSWMKVRSSIKEKVSFQQFNLKNGSSPWTSQFNVIFCRNVLIYFPKEVITQVIETLYQAAAPGAVLFIGHSESLQNLSVSWTYFRPSILVKGSLP